MAIVSHFLDILRAERLLGVGNALSKRMRLTQEVRKHWLHAGPGKKGCRIILGNERSGRYDGVALALHIVQEFCTYFVDG